MSRLSFVARLRKDSSSTSSPWWRVGGGGSGGAAVASVDTSSITGAGAGVDIRGTDKPVSSITPVSLSTSKNNQFSPLLASQQNHPQPQYHQTSPAALQSLPPPGSGRSSNSGLQSDTEYNQLRQLQQQQQQQQQQRYREQLQRMRSAHQVASSFVTYIHRVNGSSHSVGKEGKFMVSILFSTTLEQTDLKKFARVITTITIFDTIISRGGGKLDRDKFKKLENANFLTNFIL
ncbi:unnamed protein product [Protopolystoma xenopodis]|uniref:Uncharacterized protein n=1 Tax=Protopolystoma xenopodis TaxID=117903 RepID=A0A3S4ZQR7_9PLAT|nr:unnamed protein product [Protopolystoma xenopodis]